MDERSRRLERTSRASGDRTASARAAHEHLRAARFEAALEALGEESPAAPALEVAARALALTGLGRHESALAVLEGAVARGLGAELDPAALLEALGPSLQGAAPLGRARAARLLARVSPQPDAPGAALAPALEALRADQDPLVRLAFVRERPRFVGDPTPVSRVYGSHGGDFKFGRFIAFDAPVDIRLRTFEPALFDAVTEALAALAGDASLVATLELGAAFGAEVWGLGGNDHAIDAEALGRAIARLNALDLLPWTVRDCDVRPFDSMDDDGRFVRRLARDMNAHPTGRQKPYDEAAPLLERILAKHPWKGPPCTREDLAPLLEEARRSFTRWGFDACEEFARRTRGELRL